MNRAGVILVVGDVMNDVIVRPDGPPAPGTDRPAVISRRPGGSGANIACWLGHAGAHARFAGRVGADDAAAHEEALRRCGATPFLAIDQARETGVVVALLGAGGERSFFTDRGANLGLCEADLPPALLDGATALHVSGHAFFTPGPRDAVMALMARAAANGVAISVDAGSAGWLARIDASDFWTWTRRAALCFANADEAALLGGGETMLAVTLGASGAELRAGEATLRLAAKPALVLDGTGAGDAFAAGFLAASLSGAGPAERLSAGIEMAARCVALPGGRPTSGR